MGEDTILGKLEIIEDGPSTNKIKLYACTYKYVLQPEEALESNAGKHNPLTFMKWVFPT